MTNTEFIKLKTGDIIKRKNNHKDNKSLVYMIIEDYKEGGSYIYTDKGTISILEHDDLIIADIPDFLSMQVSYDDNWVYMGHDCIHRTDIVSFKVQRNELSESRNNEVFYCITVFMAKHNELDEITITYKRPVSSKFKNYKSYREEQMDIMKYFTNLSKHHGSVYNNKNAQGQCFDDYM